MSDEWDEDGKAQPLSIPGMALPGLRDLRIQFVALIEWDMFLGPVVHIKELSNGSSYIKKLKNYQTLSEVYAGVARADVDVLTTPEDIIGVFRYDHPDESDVTGVLLISCIPDTDMEPIRKIGSRTIIRSKANPENIGKELSLSLREYQTAARTFERFETGAKIKILDENQVLKPLDFDFVKGIAMIDLEGNVADFKNFPRYFDGKDLEAMKILNYLDHQYENLQPKATTTLLFNNVPLIINRIDSRSIFFLTVVNNPNLVQIMHMGEWMKLSANLIEEEWRYASKDEIMTMLAILEQSFHLNSPPEFISTYLHTAMISGKLKPILQNFNEDISKPEFIHEDYWDIMTNLDGNASILSLSKEIKADPFDVIRFFEWGRHRNIIEYLKN